MAVPEDNHQVLHLCSAGAIEFAERAEMMDLKDSLGLIGRINVAVGGATDFTIQLAMLVEKCLLLVLDQPTITFDTASHSVL